MKVQGKLFRVTSRNDIQGSLWGRIKIADHGTIWVSNFFGQLPTIHGSPSSQRLISYILSYAFDKTIKRDTKCFEKSFLASAHPRLICYQLLLMFSEMNFSRSHFHFALKDFFNKCDQILRRLWIWFHIYWRKPYP